MWKYLLTRERSQRKGKHGKIQKGEGILNFWNKVTQGIWKQKHTNWKAEPWKGRQTFLPLGKLGSSKEEQEVEGSWRLGEKSAWRFKAHRHLTRLGRKSAREIGFQQQWGLSWNQKHKLAEVQSAYLITFSEQLQKPGMLWGESKLLREETKKWLA